MNNEMLEHKEYEIIAKRVLYNFCNNAVAEHIYTDPIKFGTVVGAVMTADWKWNGTGSKYGYRKQRVQWAVYRILQESNSTNKIFKMIPFSQFEHDDFYVESPKSFTSQIEQNDYMDYIEGKINTSNILSDNEKQVLIGKIIKNKTIKEMSEEFGTLKESIRQTLQRGIEKIGKSLCVV